METAELDSFLGWHFVNFNTELQDSDLQNISEKIYTTILQNNHVSERWYKTLTLEHKILLCTISKELHEWLEKKDKKIKKMKERIDMEEILPNGPIEAERMKLIIKTFKPRKIKIINYIAINRSNTSNFLRAFDENEFEEITLKFYDHFPILDTIRLKTDYLKINNFSKFFYHEFFRLTNMFLDLKKIELIDCSFLYFHFSFLHRKEINTIIIKDSTINVPWNKITSSYIERNFKNIITFVFDIQNLVERTRIRLHDKAFIDDIFKNSLIIKSVANFKITIPHQDFNLEHFNIFKNSRKLKKLTLNVELHQRKDFFLKIKSIVEYCFWLQKIEIEIFCCCSRNVSYRASRIEFNKIKTIFREEGKIPSKYSFTNLCGEK